MPAQPSFDDELDQIARYLNRYMETFKLVDRLTQTPISIL